MSELIDREATVKQICKIGEMLGISHDRDVALAIALFVQEDKSAFPTVERPHGEWLWKTTFNNIPYCKCSVCGIGMGNTEWDFCPNCGADMRKGEAE